AVVALITVAAVMVIPRLGEELFPTFKEDEFLSHWLTKPGTSITEQRRITESVSREIRAIPGVKNFGSHIGQAFSADEPNGVDLAKAEQFGLKPGDVRRQASTLVEGEEVGDIYRAAKTYDVNVWSIPNTRSSFTGIQNLPIDTPEGQQIRLADVADVAIKPTPNFIRHESQQRRIDVLANADGRDLGSVVKDIKQRLGAVKFPVGYHSEALGHY